MRLDPGAVGSRCGGIPVRWDPGAVGSRCGVTTVVGSCSVELFTIEVPAAWNLPAPQAAAIGPQSARTASP